MFHPLFVFLNNTKTNMFFSNTAMLNKIVLTSIFNRSLKLIDDKSKIYTYGPLHLPDISFCIFLLI